MPETSPVGECRTCLPGNISGVVEGMMSGTLVVDLVEAAYIISGSFGSSPSHATGAISGPGPGSFGSSSAIPGDHPVQVLAHSGHHRAMPQGIISGPGDWLVRVIRICKAEHPGLGQRCPRRRMTHRNEDEHWQCSSSLRCVILRRGHRWPRPGVFRPLQMRMTRTSQDPDRR